MIVQKKNNFISIAKGLGIILMVLGHCGAPEIIVKYIYQFHMPLFFFCSGYFLSINENKKSLYLFYWKRIKGIYLKFLFWSLLFLSLHNVFFNCNIYNNLTIFQGKPSYLYNTSDFMQKAIKITFSMNENELLLRSFWFLKQLFLSSLLVSTILFFLNKLSQHKFSQLLILFILLSITLISKYFDWSIPAIWDISLVFMSSTFYYSGYIFHEYKTLNKIRNKYLYLILFILSIIGLFSLPWTNMLEYTIITAIPFFIVAYSGIILTLLLSKWIESQKIRYVFYYLGQNTMIILVLHMLSFKFGNLLKIIFYEMPMYKVAEFQVINENNNFFWIIYTIIGISIPLLFDYLMKGTKTSKKIWKYLT